MKNLWYFLYSIPWFPNVVFLYTSIYAFLFFNISYIFFNLYYQNGDVNCFDVVQLKSPFRWYFWHDNLRSFNVFSSCHENQSVFLVWLPRRIWEFFCCFFLFLFFNPHIQSILLLKTSSYASLLCNSFCFFLNLVYRENKWLSSPSLSQSLTVSINISIFFSQPLSFCLSSKNKHSSKCKRKINCVLRTRVRSFSCQQNISSSYSHTFLFSQWTTLCSTYFLKKKKEETKHALNYFVLSHPGFYFILWYYFSS